MPASFTFCCPCTSSAAVEQWGREGEESAMEELEDAAETDDVATNVGDAESDEDLLTEPELEEGYRRQWAKSREQEELVNTKLWYNQRPGEWLFFPGRELCPSTTGWEGVMKQN